MKLKEAYDYFNTLKINSNKKSEIKIYNAFLNLISDLGKRDFMNLDLLALELKLDELELKSNPTNSIKYFRKRLNEFKNYLKDEFSLISEGYYIAIGISLGVAFGVVLGSSFGIGNDIAIGMSAGLSIGAYLDYKAKKENRVLITKS